MNTVDKPSSVSFNPGSYPKLRIKPRELAWRCSLVPTEDALYYLKITSF